MKLLTINFMHTGQELTYGPPQPWAKRENHLASMISSFEIATGGGSNGFTVYPRNTTWNVANASELEATRVYSVRILLPLVAATLFELDESKFRDALGIDYYVQKLNLKDLMWTLT